MEKQKTKDQKIPTGYGVVILIIIAVTVGVGVWEWYVSTNNQDNILIQNNGIKRNITSKKEEQEEQPAEIKTSLANNNDNISKKIKTSSFDNWKTYSDKSIGIEMKYPPELFLSSSEGKVIFDYFDSNDPMQKNESSVLMHFNVYSSQETKKQYISEHKLDTLLNFKKEQIQLNNTLADKITYSDAFTGGNIYTFLMEKNQKLIIIYYDGDSLLKDTFNKMISTVNIM